MGDALWSVLTQVGGHVAGLRRRMLRAQEEGVLGTLGAEFVPSLATLHRAVKDELWAGRVLQVARVASGLVVPSRFDRALAELGFTDEVNGPLVVDGPDAMPSGAGGEQQPNPAKAAARTRTSGGVRLYAPGARLVSTRQVAGVMETVGHTVAARGIGCVYGPQDMLPRHTVPGAGVRPVRRYWSTLSVTQRFCGYVPWPSSSAVRSTPTPSPRARAMWRAPGYGVVGSPVPPTTRTGAAPSAFTWGVARSPSNGQS